MHPIQARYDLQGQLLGESVFNPNSPAVNRQDYLWLDNRPVATGTGAALYYVHSDQLNTPRRLTDQAQTIVWRWDADAFGQGAPNNDPDGDGQAVRLDLRFPGQLQMDAGLVYNYFRDYDPTVGRYVQSDPIGLLGGINSYGYVGQNPLIAIDPLGLFCLSTEAIQIISATLGGAASGALFTPLPIFSALAGGLFAGVSTFVALSLQSSGGSISAAAASSTAIGAIAGGVSSRAASGAIAGGFAGAVGSLENSSASPCNLLDIAAGGAVGGAVGGFLGEIVSPSSSSITARAAPVFSAGRGFASGFVGGLVQDIVSTGLTASFDCNRNRQMQTRCDCMP